MTNLHSRADWAAKPPKRDQAPFVPANVEGVCIHYTGGGSRAGITDTAAYLRSIQAFYFNGANSGDDYSDIAYNAAVDLRGGVWEARGWTVKGAANGPGGSNSTHPSIFLIMGDADDVTPEMRDGVRAAIAQFRSIYPSCLEVRGHQEFYGTSCPGPAMALVRDGSFEPVDAAADTTSEEEDEAMYLIRPKGYWDTYLIGAGEPKHVHDPADAQFLVDAGKVSYFGKPVSPGTPYVSATEVWPVSLVGDVAGFDPASGTHE